MKIKLIYSLFLILLNFSLTAQRTLQPCSDKNYRDFDFWLGSWEVFDSNNNLIGTNNVIKTPNACAIQENWTSKTSLNQGTSYNYFDASDQKWHQVWIDNSGSVLNLEGNFINGKMILKSKLVKNKNQEYYHQISWSKEGNDVLQTWNYIDQNGNVIKEVFKGIYKKINRINK